MFSDTTLFIITLVCILFLVTMLIALAAGTRMKGGAGWAAVVIVTTTVPAYLTTLTLDSGVGLFLAAWFFAITMNTLCLPALWFFVRSQFEGGLRFRWWRDTLHFLPALVSLAAHIIYYALLAVAEIEAERAILETGDRNLPAAVNEIIVFGQFFAYYAAIFLYIRRRKRYLQDNYSDSRILGIRWTVQLVAVTFVLFFVVFGVYVAASDHAVWIVPMLNVVAMGYLVYIIIRHTTEDYLNRLPDIPAAALERNSATAPAMSEAQMREICDRVTEYLQTTKAYINPDLSANELSIKTGIHSRNISIAINGYLHKNFFDLVNEMRIGEAKRLLLSLDKNLTVNSIYSDCGFRTDRSLFRTFKKFESISPDMWRKNNT